jgi:putative peptidoglycan lipid II flippase
LSGSATSNLAKSAGIVAFGSILSKVLGFLRESALASEFGATHATDAYLMAMIIPTLMLFGVGPAVTTTLIPVFTDLEKRKGRDAAFRSVSCIINACIVVAAGVMVAGFIFAEPIVGFVAPGFSGETYALTVKLTRILFPIALFTVVAHCVTGVLHAIDKFAVPAMVGLVQNVIVITSILVFGPRYGITAVAVGTALGAASMLLVQLPALFSAGFRYHLTLDWHDAGLRQVGRLIGPIVLGSVAGQAGTVVIRTLASRLPEGSITYLNYSQRLVGLPVGVFGSALVTVLYPALARMYSENKRDDFSKMFRRSVGVVFFTLLPMAVGLAVLATPVVRLAFERRAFTPEATAATAAALAYACVGIPATSLSLLSSRAFYAMQDTITPVVVNMLAVGVNVGISLALVGPMGHVGLALGGACQPIASFLILQAVLRYREKKWMRKERPNGLEDRYSLAASIAKSVVSATVMWAAVSFFDAWITTALPGAGTGLQIVRLGGSVGVGVVVYFAVAAIFKSQELSFAFNTAKKRVAVRRSPR